MQRIGLARLCADQIETSTSPPRANPGHLTIFCAREWGIWRVRPSRGWGIWPCLGGVGNIWTGSVRFQIAFFGGGAEVANSYKRVFGRDGRVQRKRYSITKKAYKKKVFKSESDSMYINDVDFWYNESSCGFVRQWIVKEKKTAALA